MGQLTIVESLESRALFSGGVDLSFGTNGVLSGYQSIAPNGVAQAMVAQPDGKLLVAISYGDAAMDANVPQTGEAVIRLQADGTVDPTFGDQGYVRFGAPFPALSAIALQPDGKILLTGNTPSVTSVTNVILDRLNSDGSLDTTFAGSGSLTVPQAAGGGPSHVAVQADGKIVVATTVGNSSVVARYLADGEIDPSFGNGGQSVSHLRYSGNADSVVITGGGKIIVGTDDGILRLTPSGTVDSTFGQKGFAQLLTIRRFNTAVGTALQSDGKIVVGGLGLQRFQQSSTLTMAAIRLTTSGEIDKSFGSGGLFSYAFPNRSDLSRSGFPDGRPVAIAIDKKGRIVLGGSTGEDPDFAAVRLTSSGQFDASFGGHGTVRAGSGNLWPGLDEDARAMTVLPDGSVVLAGSSSNGSNNETVAGLALMQFTTAGKLDPRFGYDGRAGIFPIVPPADTAAIQSDGKLLLVSTRGVARVLPDGSLDPTFGDKGMRLSAVDAIDDSAKNIGRNVLFVTPLAMGQSLVATSVYGNISGKQTISLTRYTAAGQVDPTFVFHDSVYKRLARQAPGLYLESAAVQSDGRIVLEGRGDGLSSDVLVLARLTRHGQLDPTFGTRGVLTAQPLQATGGTDLPLMIDSQDRPIIMETATTPDGNNAIITVRYTRDGKPDSSFPITPVPIFSGNILNAVPRSDHTIDVLVSADTGVRVIRLTDGAPDPTFGTGGTLPLGAAAGLDLRYPNCATIANGDYLVGLYLSSGAGSSIIAAFTRDGNLDPSFGSAGTVTLPQELNPYLPLVSPVDGSITFFDSSVFDGPSPKLVKILV